MPHKLIPAMPFSRITNTRLAKHTHACATVCVCLCVGILYDELLPCRMTDHLAIGLAFAPHKIAIFLQVLNEKLF